MGGVRGRGAIQDCSPDASALGRPRYLSPHAGTLPTQPHHHRMARRLGWAVVWNGRVRLAGVDRATVLLSGRKYDRWPPEEPRSVDVTTEPPYGAISTLSSEGGQSL